MGFCVVGRAKHPVKGVTIRNLSVQKFKGNGVFGIYTDRFTVMAVVAKKNGEYGIAGTVPPAAASSGTGPSTTMRT